MSFLTIIWQLCCPICSTAFSNARAYSGLFYGFPAFFAILLGFLSSIFYQFSSPSIPTAGVVIDNIHNSSTKIINVLTFGTGGAILQLRGAHESFSTPFDEKSIHGAKRQTRLYSESAFSALTGFFNKKKPIQRPLSLYRLF